MEILTMRKKRMRPIESHESFQDATINAKQEGKEELFSLLTSIVRDGIEDQREGGRDGQKRANRSCVLETNGSGKEGWGGTHSWGGKPIRVASSGFRPSPFYALWGERKKENFLGLGESLERKLVGCWIKGVPRDIREGEERGTRVVETLLTYRKSSPQADEQGDKNDIKGRGDARLQGGVCLSSSRSGEKKA